METTGREQIKTETEGEIRGTKNGADFFDEPKKLVRVKRETEKDVVVEHCLGWVILNYLYWEKWASIGYLNLAYTGIEVFEIENCKALK